MKRIEGSSFGSYYLTYNIPSDRMYILPNRSRLSKHAQSEVNLIRFICEETCNPLSKHSITLTRQKLEQILWEEW